MNDVIVYGLAALTMILFTAITMWESKKSYMQGYKDGLRDAEKATIEILDRKFKKK